MGTEISIFKKLLYTTYVKLMPNIFTFRGYPQKHLLKFA